MPGRGMAWRFARSERVVTTSRFHRRTICPVFAAITMAAERRGGDMTIKRVLIAGPLIPEVDRESGSQRVYDTITFLRDAGWSVSFVAENARGGDRYVRLLQQQGVAVYNGFNHRFERLLTRGRLDLVVFAFWHLAEAQMELVRRLAPRARILVDTIALHFLRDARRLFQSARITGSSVPVNSEGALDAGYGSKLVRELNTYAAADGVLTVS